MPQKSILLFLSILFIFSLKLRSQNIDSVKVAFLTQDVADGYDHAGGTPDIIHKIEKYFKNH